MRILFLGDVNSSHIIKWVKAISEKGIEAGLFTLTRPEFDWYSERGIKIFEGGNYSKQLFSASLINKVAYIKSAAVLKNIIKDFKPDIVHAHYATSYGMLGRISKFHPFFLSVWGSDILDFPRKSFVHKWLLKSNLKAADKIFATSKMLNEDVFAISQRDSVVIPFGIDVNIFKPHDNKSEKDTLVIGTIKTLEKHYCIDILIQAFAKVLSFNTSLKLKLLIIGEGKERDTLQLLVQKLGISNAVAFVGRIPYPQIHEYHNKIDIFANLSAYESFGVSVLEASASGNAVVVTNINGLSEVIIKNKTALTVPVGDVDATAKALTELLSNKYLREEMGHNGRKFVVDNYDWQQCVDKMISNYKSVELKVE